MDLKRVYLRNAVICPGGMGGRFQKSSAHAGRVEAISGLDHVPHDGITNEFP